MSEPSPEYDGYWPLTLDQGDPIIVFPQAQWQAEDVPRVLIRAAYRTQGNTAEMFFAGPDGVFTGAKRVAIPIIPDGVVRTYEVDLSAHDLYSVTTAEISAVPESHQPKVDFVLESNFPNPFNPRTAIRYHLAKAGRVNLSVFDSAGHLVRVLESGTDRNAGRHEKIWDGRDITGRDVSSGTYFYRLQVGESAETGKMLLVR